MNIKWKSAKRILNSLGLTIVLISCSASSSTTATATATVEGGAPDKMKSNGVESKQNESTVQNSNGKLIDPRIEARVDSVLSLMTIEEKVGQLNQHTSSWEMTGPVPEGDYQQKRVELMKKGGVGSMLNVVGAEATRKAQQLVVENSRLKIPLIFGYDVIHGFKTIYPLPIAEASSWDLEMIEKSSRYAAIEATASGLHWTFAPMMDISREPRWGRVMEGAGEDPFLGARVAEARIKGFQTDDMTAINTMAATAKHFAGYGFAEAGRDYNTVEISPSTLWNVVFPPFKASVDAGVATVMGSFNDVDGVPVSASDYLQNEVLRDKWGFNGFIISDWGTIRQLLTHGYVPDRRTAAKKAILAGNDMDMESEAFQEHLVDLVQSGEVPESVIDKSVRRVLRIKFLLGLFEDPYKYSDVNREKELHYAKEHVQHAREIAQRSIVLLKNDKNVLPLSSTKSQKIAVIGKLAADKDSPIGSWRGRGEANSAVSLLEGVKAAVSENVEVEYAEGYTLAEGDRNFVRELNFPVDEGKGFSKALEISKDADLVIMVVGEEGFQSGEGRSQVDISLKGRQLELLQKVSEVNSNVVVVMMNGRPIVEPWLYDNMPTILEAWHLGSEAGNAIADVLFGKYNPSAKLTMSIPRAVGQIPVYYNHKSTGRGVPQKGDVGTVFWSHFTDESNEPQFPFGYGLSYTSFEYSKPSISDSVMSMNGSVEVKVTVKNTGELAGEEVVQLYIHDHFASLVRPVMELKGFEKIELAPNESKEVTFKIDKELLSFYTTDGDFIAEPGTFTIMVGTNSDDVQKLNLELK